MARVKEITARQAIASAAFPPGHWPACDVAALPARLADGVWTLVEFWAPDNLFSRLLAPVRVNLPHSHGSRIRLVCCTVASQDHSAAAFGATALPALILFHGRTRVRRWIGAIDRSILCHDIDRVLDAAAVDIRGVTVAV